MPLMTKQQRTSFFDKLHTVYPNPRCELDFSNQYTLLVAIILSAQSTDKSVNKVTPALFKAADTPQKMVDLGEQALKEHIKSINYFNNKAKSIMGLSSVLTEHHNSLIPEEFDTLLTLPGVGRKTASVFLNVAYRAPYIGVDTHIFRLCHRLKICTGKTPTAIQEKLQKVVPAKYKPDVALALVLHGRYICTAKKPKCTLCPLIDVCFADEKNTLSLPQKGKK